MPALPGACPPKTGHQHSASWTTASPFSSSAHESMTDMPQPCEATGHEGPLLRFPSTAASLDCKPCVKNAPHYTRAASHAMVPVGHVPWCPHFSTCGPRCTNSAPEPTNFFTTHSHPADLPSLSLSMLDASPGHLPAHIIGAQAPI